VTYDVLLLGAEVANSEGRLPGGNKLVLGGDDSEEAWRALDEKVMPRNGGLWLHSPAII
jgi:hypothetical protein